MIITILLGMLATFFVDGKETDLNSSNFDQLVLRSNKAVFVKFFSPNCGHCVRLAPIWKSLAENISEHVTIGSVNCQVSQDLCGRYQIQGVPSLKMFTRSDKDDKLMVLDFNEERKLENLIAYAKRHAVSYIYTIDSTVSNRINKRHVTLDEFLAKGKELPKVILFSQTKKSASLPLKSLSSKFFRKFVIGAVSLKSNEELFKKYNVHADMETLLIISPSASGENGIVRYSGKMSFTPLSDFLQDYLNENGKKKIDL